MKKAINILGNFVLAICFLLFLAVFLTPTLFGFTFNTILSGSMQPTLGVGEVIGIEKVEFKDVKVSDVISFKVEGMDTPVCHRVIEIVETEEGIGFRTKGDANEEPDPWVITPKNLIGRMTFHVPYVGYLAKFVKSKIGFGILIGLPALLIVILEIKNLFWPKKTSTRRPRRTPKSDRTPAYICLLIGLVLIGALYGLTAKNTQERILGSFAGENKEADQPLYTSERDVQNKGMFPLVICFYSEDKTVSFSESYFRLSPGSQKTIEIGGDSEEAVIKTGCFFPLLPKETLYQLFVWNSQFAPLVAVAVWIFPLTMIVFVVLIGLTSKPKLAERRKFIKSMKRRLSHG